MDKQQVLARIKEVGVVPVIRAESPELAMRAIDAIRAGGITVAEITMTVPSAVELIAQVSANFGDEVLVGAGTVLDPQTAAACIQAGARFVVSPALNLGTVQYCRENGIAVLPGALTPTEVVNAWSAGADMVKVFPCGAMGGANYLRSLKAPLPDIPLIPTGGVSLTTAGDFIAAGAEALGVGADLVDIRAIREGYGEKITKAAQAYLQAVGMARSQQI
jgi:2-dehydro-3-deoxyphosphogluconate aldolase/(4S)-4-hydroxy-2-oxoglutarate aldolase